MRMGFLLLAAISVLSAPVLAETSNLGLGETAPKASPGWVTAATCGGALVGTAPFGVCMFLSTLSSYSDGTGAPGLGMYVAVVLTAAGAIVSPFTTAGGTCIAGGVMHQGGRYWPTVGGAAIGTAVALPLAAVSIVIEPGDATATVVKCAFAGLSTLAVPAGAVIGYNISRPMPDRRSSFEGRLELPSLAVRQERLADKSGLTVYDARLVTVRL